MKKIFTFLSLLLIVSMLTAQNPFANFKSQNPTKNRPVKHNTSVKQDSPWASLKTQQTSREINYATVTLPLDTTFIFSEENVYDLSEMFGAPILGVVFKFTLSSLKTISISEGNDLFDIGLFYDNLNNYVTDGATIADLYSRRLFCSFTGFWWQSYRPKHSSYNYGRRY